MPTNIKPKLPSLESCVDKYIPQPGELTPEAIQQMIDCFRNSGNLLRANTQIIPSTHATKWRATIVRNNLAIFK
jgi:hypothetical protein